MPALPLHLFTSVSRKRLAADTRVGEQSIRAGRRLYYQQWRVIRSPRRQDRRAPGNHLHRWPYFHRASRAVYRLRSPVLSPDGSALARRALPSATNPQLKTSRPPARPARTYALVLGHPARLGRHLQARAPGENDGHRDALPPRSTLRTHRRSQRPEAPAVASLAVPQVRTAVARCRCRSPRPRAGRSD